MSSGQANGYSIIDKKELVQLYLQIPPGHLQMTSELARKCVFKNVCKENPLQRLFSLLGYLIFLIYCSLYFISNSPSFKNLYKWLHNKCEFLSCSMKSTNQAVMTVTSRTKREQRNHSTLNNQSLACQSWGMWPIKLY